MAKPIVAIVGRPNVGKSTLFNKIVGERISIVEDTPGVTRDRIYANADWVGYEFTLIDTGGLEPESKDIILSQMFSQAEIAIESADVIMFVVDIQSGALDYDNHVANILRRSKKPIVLVVNKVDNMRTLPLELYDFYSLGLGDPIPVSASQGLGTGDLLDEVVKHFKDKKSYVDKFEDAIKVAIIGKPNVGKSSLINKILGEDRLIVSDIPGTTRDSIDTMVTVNHQKYIFIDTAGMRRKSKVKEDIEKFSLLRAIAAIDRADVCVLMIDATDGATDQDTKIAGIAHERGKAAIIAVNKWDAIEKNNKTMKEFTKKIETEFAYMAYAPKIFISALTGQRIDNLFELIQTVSENSTLRIATGVLNEVIIEATSMNQPPTDKGRSLKIYYATQVSVKPPTFILFVNSHELMHFSYKRYLENQIRLAFGFIGTPIHFLIRNKDERE